MRVTWILAFGVAAFGIIGCSSDAPSREDVERGESPLYLAPIDPDHPFAVGVCTGALNTDPARGEIGACVAAASARCTGSLVAPNLVLTARHCVHTLTPPEFEEDFQCTQGHKFTEEPFFPGGVRITTSHSGLWDKPVWVDVQRILVTTTTDMCTDDVALLILNKNVTDVRPAWVDLRRDLKYNPPADGKVAIVGRGRVTPTDRGQGERRFLRNIPFTCSGAPCDLPWGNKGFVYRVVNGQFAIGQSTLPGDSGAGVLLNENFDTEPTVVGVESLGFEDADGIPLHSIPVSLHPHARWIAGVAIRAARLGGYPVPAWANVRDPEIPPPVDQ